MPLQKLKNINRFMDILFILLSYGYDEIVLKLNLPRSMSFRKVRKKGTDLKTPERIRLVLEELGPSFIKIGQFLSTRPDIFEEDYISALSKLQNKGKPIPFSEIAPLIEKEMGQGLEDVFSSVEHTPLGTASISQVHRAKLKENGEAVVVKVQKPGIDETVRSDLEIIEFILEELKGKVDAIERYNLQGIVQEMQRNFSRELDFRNEAYNLMTFRQQSLSEKVLAPKVYLNLTTTKVMVMEEMTNLLTIDDIAKETALAKEVSLLGVQAVLHQILVNGFFHADPHPGNVFFSKKGEIIFLDFGLMGRLSQSMQYKVANLLRAVASQNSESIVDTILDMTPHYPGIDKNKLEIEVMEMLTPFYGNRLQEIHVGDFLGRFIILLREHRLKVDPNYTFMLKAMITTESLARRLNPEIDLVHEAVPFLTRIFKDQYSFYPFIKRVLFANHSLFKLIRDLPERLDVIMRKMESDTFRMEFEHIGLEPLISRGEKALNNLSIGIILAAFLISSSWMMAAHTPPLLWGEYSIFALLGFFASVLLSILLFFRILKH